MTWADRVGIAFGFCVVIYILSFDRFIEEPPMPSQPETQPVTLDCTPTPATVKILEEAKERRMDAYYIRHPRWPEDYATFVAAVVAVESGGRLYARGKAGEIGPLQIIKAYWKDAKMPFGTFENCDDLRYATEVMHHYFMRYCSNALSDMDFTTMAAIHHRGPRAMDRFMDSVELQRYVARVLILKAEYDLKTR